jgi:hypothetical protein
VIDSAPQQPLQCSKSVQNNNTVVVAVEGRDTQCRGTISSVVGDGVPDRRGDRGFALCFEI